MNYTIILVGGATTKLSEQPPNINVSTITNNASEDMFKCSSCKKEFYKLNLLRRHERRIHKRYLKKAINKDKNIKCEMCDKMFSSLQSRSKHRISKHGIKKSERKTTEGGLYLQFNTELEFNNWLTSEEQNTKAHFIAARGEKKYKDHRSLHYICSRSGKFVSCSTGKRKLKAQGSKKIGKSCSARLAVKVFENRVEATYFKEHNHELSLHHLPIPKAVKESITEKLLSGESYETILQEVRGDVEVPEDRHHLVTRKDLNNIKAKLTIDPETSELPNCNSDASTNLPTAQSNVLQQNVRKDENVDNKNKILSELTSLHNKVRLLSGIPKPTATKVLGELKRIGILLGIHNKSNAPKPLNKSLTSQNRNFLGMKQETRQGRSQPITTEHPIVEHVKLHNYVSQDPIFGQHYVMEQNNN